MADPLKDSENTEILHSPEPGSDFKDEVLRRAFAPAPLDIDEPDPIDESGGGTSNSNVGPQATVQRKLREITGTAKKKFEVVAGKTRQEIDSMKGRAADFADTAGARLTDFRETATETATRWKREFDEQLPIWRAQARHSVKRTKEIAKAHPLETIAIAAAIGFALGMTFRVGRSRRG